MIKNSLLFCYLFGIANFAGYLWLGGRKINLFVAVCCITVPLMKEK